MSLFNLEQQPLVSIVVPVYNVERYLAECLNSILCQTYTNWECIIVNDDSPDNSLEIIREFMSIDSRFKLIYQENRGLAGARNSGIAAAKGMFIAFLDSDDIYEPTKLEKHVQHLLSNSEIGISFSPSQFIDENSNRLATYQKPQLKDITPELLLKSNPVGNGSAPVIRKATLDYISFQLSSEPDRVFYFDEDLKQSEDIECWFRILTTSSWIMEGIFEPLTLYRINTSSLSADGDKKLQSWELFISKAKQYSPDIINKFENIARACEYRYLARRSIRSNQSKNALRYIIKAYQSDFNILFEEPRRTILTTIVILLMQVFPTKFFARL